MESKTGGEAKAEAAGITEDRAELEESWFDQPHRPRSVFPSAFPKPDPGIDPLADDWFR